MSLIGLLLLFLTFSGKLSITCSSQDTYKFTRER